LEVEVAIQLEELNPLLEEVLIILLIAIMIPLQVVVATPH
jgi:hypothetical protein